MAYLICGKSHKKSGTAMISSGPAAPVKHLLSDPATMKRMLGLTPKPNSTAKTSEHDAAHFDKSITSVLVALTGLPLARNFDSKTGFSQCSAI